MGTALAHRLLSWHRPVARQFAFRATTDPWAVLVSEVMLQQTQAPRVERHWIAFIGRYPTPDALAHASVGDAIRSWQGLGYNRRAVRLRETAVAIVERHDGQVPWDPTELATLPGIGPYTARAVAAIAFGAPVAALDTNIRRVVGRVMHGHGHAADPGPIPGPARVQVDADALLEGSDPRAWTLAAMDLGATICRPRTPRCDACPLVELCRFAAHAAMAAGATTVPRPAPRAVSPAPSFETTNRWLRGRLVEALRSIPPGEWTAIAGPIGRHSQQAIAAAVQDLRRDGIVEMDGEGRARLPV